LNPKCPGSDGLNISPYPYDPYLPWDNPPFLCPRGVLVGKDIYHKAVKGYYNYFHYALLQGGGGDCMKSRKILIFHYNFLLGSLAGHWDMLSAASRLTVTLITLLSLVVFIL
jgi:hypothetical protein